MPSFDIVSEVDKQEVTNAVDQANRELKTRFDFKGVDAEFSLTEHAITAKAPSDFQVQQMQDIIKNKMIKREIDARALDFQPINAQLHQATQVINVKQGIDQPMAKKIVKIIKDQKMKVQAAVQGDQVRVTGKKRDDLQDVITMLKGQDLELPLQFVNFRD